MAEQFKQFHKSSRYNWFISNHGNIYTVTSTGKVRHRKSYTTGGYAGSQYASISINDAPEKYVHRIVAMMFIPNPDNKPTINHKDGNKTNNHISNLEWATYSENQQHAIDVLLQTRSKEPKRDLRMITFEAAEEIRKQWSNGSCTLTGLGKDYGLHASSIKQIVENKTYVKP